MKTNLLTNLLIVVAVGLCSLCTFQWIRETSSQKEIQGLLDKRFELETTVQQQTNTLHRMDFRIAELTAAVSRLESTLRTNEAALLELRAERNTLQATNALFSQQLEAYAEAFHQTTNRLAAAYADITKQNDLLGQVTAQRDDYVSRLNESIRKRNEIVTQYNDLVKKVEAFQLQTGPARNQP